MNTSDPPPSARVSEEDAWSVAVHESGHIVAGSALGVHPYAVSLIRTDEHEGVVKFPAFTSTPRTMREARQALVISAAGAAAVEEVLGPACRAGDFGDRCQSAAIIRSMFGLAGTTNEVSEAELAKAKEVAKSIVQLHRENVLEVARMLRHVYTYIGALHGAYRRSPQGEAAGDATQA